jgi:hypothetical protein
MIVDFSDFFCTDFSEVTPVLPFDGVGPHHQNTPRSKKFWKVPNGGLIV